MPRSKSSRRRARQQRQHRAMLWQEPSAESADDEAPAPARGRSLREARAARTAVTPEAAAWDPWSGRFLVVLLICMAVTLTILDLVIGIEQRSCVPVALQTFSWSPLFVVLSGAATSSIARAITGAPRNLRFLEALSAGAVLAISQTILLEIASALLPLPATKTLANGCVSNVSPWVDVATAVVDVLSLGATYVLMPRVARILFRRRW